MSIHIYLPSIGSLWLATNKKSEKPYKRNISMDLIFLTWSMERGSTNTHKYEVYHYICLDLYTNVHTKVTKHNYICMEKDRNWPSKLVLGYHPYATLEILKHKGRNKDEQKIQPTPFFLAWTGFLFFFFFFFSL